MERLHERLAAGKPLAAAEIMQAALAGEYGGAPIELDAAAQQLIRELSAAGEVASRQGSRRRCALTNSAGYSWLLRNARAGFGSVIADDMSLGKTLQVIATMQKLKEDGQLHDGALVVVPTSLLTNWQKEIARFAPGLRVDIFHGSKRVHFDLWWNPAVEAQATDRAYRIGQHENVPVHRLITRATFEERTDEMISAKKELAEMAVGVGETWIGKLDGEELRELFTLRQ